ncbi:hypothetical protein [Rhizobium sp. AG207R]|uniref:hypothetical protein n=1 Tax=Rhizobium sp. AG207R TaxID=2802287 RepID=UPI0022ABFF55|nr:hypothetical protein [Rhizobium sp. AG207R]
MSYTFDFEGLLPYWDQFAEGVWLTIQLSVAATIVGFVLGTFCAIARTSGLATLKTVVGAYGADLPADIATLNGSVSSEPGASVRFTPPNRKGIVT